MFRIPTFNKMEMTFEEAINIIEIDGDLLKGMEHVSEHWDRYCADETLYTDEVGDFFDTWISVSYTHLTLPTNREV